METQLGPEVGAPVIVLPEAPVIIRPHEYPSCEESRPVISVPISKAKLEDGSREK